MDIKAYLSEKRTLVEKALRQVMLTSHGPLSHHLNSLTYSVNAGGKRVRPILCIAAAESLGKSLADDMTVPCALECIHTYSLIHDDLPAMDDDALRRGKPTNHMVYGEAGAILAGDGLLTFAFELLSQEKYPSDTLNRDRLQLINIIAKASGSLGMVGGQALDIDSEEKDISLERLQMIHRCKTGALITASVQAGAILAGADESQYNALTLYGNNIGLAFQIVDDLLNVEGTTEELGKAAGSDAARNKATYPSFFGADKTRLLAAETVNAALANLADFDHRADPLRALARYIFERTN